MHFKPKLGMTEVRFTSSKHPPNSKQGNTTHTGQKDVAVSFDTQATNSGPWRHTRCHLLRDAWIKLPDMAPVWV